MAHSEYDKLFEKRASEMKAEASPKERFKSKAGKKRAILRRSK